MLSLLPAAFALSVTASNVLFSSKSCPAGGQLSCHNTTAQSDLCCFESPGGLILQTQFWDTDPSTGPSNSWTIHGLWPDNCDATYQANCDPSRAYTNITQILQQYQQTALLTYMKTYWPDYQGNDESFWEHEWAKHGTCMSTFEPSCYSSYQPGEEVPDFFQRTVDVFKTLPTYEWLANAGITPSSSKKYQLSDINAALQSPRGVEAVVQCENGALDEVWYFFNVRGSVQTGQLVPTGPGSTTSSCGDTVAYLPKSGGSSSGASTSAAPSSPPSTGSPAPTNNGTVSWSRPSPTMTPLTSSASAAPLESLN